MDPFTIDRMYASEVRVQNGYAGVSSKHSKRLNKCEASSFFGEKTKNKWKNVIPFFAHCDGNGIEHTCMHLVGR